MAGQAKKKCPYCHKYFLVFSEPLDGDVDEHDEITIEPIKKRGDGKNANKVDKRRA